MIAILFGTHAVRTSAATNYTIQLGFKFRVLNERTAHAPALTNANPTSCAWFLEVFGCAAMGVATSIVAAVLRGSRRPNAISALLILNGVVGVVGTACTAPADRWVFFAAGLVCFAGWNMLIAVCYRPIAITREGGKNVNLRGPEGRRGTVTRPVSLP